MLQKLVLWTGREIFENVQEFYALLSKSKEWNDFCPSLVLFLFDSLFSPMVNYSYAVWGEDALLILEKTHFNVWYQYDSPTWLKGLEFVVFRPPVSRM